MRNPLRMLGIAALALGIAACTKLTVENYDQIKVGMRYDEVKRLLGEPTKCSDLMTVRTCTWGDDARYVNVGFVADQVVLFSSANLR